MRAAEFRDRGVSGSELQRRVRTESLTRVRHGAYAEELAAGADERHRDLLAGTWPILGDGSVLSHATAAVLHGLPVWDGMLDRVTITRPVGGHGHTSTSLRSRLGPLTERDVTRVDGFPVTSLERTAFDLARGFDYERAVAVMDAALHASADRALLEVMVAESRGRTGIGTARAALAFADGRSESVGESLSRIRLALAGVPAPELQVDVYDEDGDWVGRSDFGWVSRGVLGEYDGKVKYRGTTGQVARTVVGEKRREGNLRDLGWVVARWGSAELAPDVLRRRFAVAFAQARPDRILGHASARPRI